MGRKGRPHTSAAVLTQMAGDRFSWADLDAFADPSVKFGLVARMAEEAARPTRLDSADYPAFLTVCQDNIEFPERDRKSVV